jgi:Fic family protein
LRIKDRERSVEEVVGCRQVLSTAYLQAKELFPLTEAIIRGLHHDLLRYYPRAASYAGGYKKTPNRVISINHQTGEQRVVLDPSPPGIITSIAMSDLVDWYNFNIRENTWPLFDVEVYRNRYAQLQKLSESALAVLNYFKSSPEKRLKVSDIEKEIALPRRTIQYALQTLTKEAFIQKLGQKAGTRYQLIF